MNTILTKDMAPIIIFVYNRLEHIKKCITSLSEAYGATDSILYIFSDGAKKGQEEKIEKVRKYINSSEIKKKFKQVIVIESLENNGLAKSIISGVSKVISEHKRCIVLEDDVIVAKDFIEYMNSGLEFYENNNMVWSIAGVNLISPEKIKEDVYFAGRICSCAWATWKDRWDLVDWNVSDYKKFKFNFKARHDFNKYGTDRSNMLDRQMFQKINSWAIRFDYAEFKHNMVSVYPKYTKAKDDGHDGKGTHFTEATDRLNVELPDKIYKYTFTDVKSKNKKIAQEFRCLLALRWQARLKRFVLREIESITGKKVFK